MIAALAHFIIGVISTLGYAGVAALMAIESACIPLPSEIILPFSGYLVSTGRFDLYLVALAGALGCNIGSTIAWVVGYIGGRPLVERWGRYILLDKGELALVDRFFERFGSLTVLVSRMLPIVRTYIALPAGIARMNFWKFQFYTFIGSIPWCFGLAYAGMRLGQTWENSPWLQSVMHGFTAFTALGILVFAAWYARKLWRDHHPREAAR